MIELMITQCENARNLLFPLRSPLAGDVDVLVVSILFTTCSLKRCALTLMLTSRRHRIKLSGIPLFSSRRCAIPLVDFVPRLALRKTNEAVANGLIVATLHSANFAHEMKKGLQAASSSNFRI